ncbi:helix-turn-helix domain-containing protein [Kitasatospora arboriphila]
MARRGDTHTRWEIGEDWHEHPSYIEAAWCAALAGAVYQERVKRGWRQEQLAEAVGITEDQVEEIEESAVYPTPDILQRLGHAFDVNVLVVTDEPLPRLEFVGRGTDHRAA